MKYQASTKLIWVFTHGRGVYTGKLDCLPPCANPFVCVLGSCVNCVVNTSCQIQKKECGSVFNGCENVTCGSCQSNYHCINGFCQMIISTTSEVSTGDMNVDNGDDNSKQNNFPIYIGVGVGAGIIIIVLVAIVSLVINRRSYPVGSVS